MATMAARDSQPLTEEFNVTGDPLTLGHCLHQLYEDAASRHSGSVALICGRDELTFEELNARANRLARVLVHRGVEHGHLVGVALGRSFDLVVALLAVLKTGAAYVPIDPALPARRIKQMVDDAQPKLVVTRAAIPDTLLSWKERCLSIDEVRACSEGDASNLGVDVRAENLAYVIYTSGSTGKPKGVEITHEAVSNLLLSMRREPGCDQTDRLLAITNISFDIAVLELFLPLLCGARTVIAQGCEAIDTGALLRLMEQHAITLMQGTPATWQQLLDAGWQSKTSSKPRLRKILCGGEVLPRRLAESLLLCGDSVWNMYGPTETTVWSSLWRVQRGEEVLVGHPVANTQLYVLGEDLEPVQVGHTGELYIGGAGLARGYHNNAELTRSRFVDNLPLFRNLGTVYRTGDVARVLGPGKLVVLGRSDGYVKVRGHRVELGDVEAAIMENRGVSRAVVVNRDHRLIAYCVVLCKSDSTSITTNLQTDQGDSDTAVAAWASAWDGVYNEEALDPIINLAGWHNSYDGRPFSLSEMRDWQQNSVSRILSYAPKRVVEIGSGSGLMLFSVAPHCVLYHATDASIQAVEKTRRQVELSSLANVVCEHREAHALPAMEGALDTVVINSVIQYFPNIEYLVVVLEWAVKAIDRGRIFLGDVRNLELLELFHRDVSQFRANMSGTLSSTERAVLSERELVISLDFFANLPSLFPRINRVDIALRNGCYVNEMTCYRVDLTLHIDAADDASTPVVRPFSEHIWRDDMLQATSLRELQQLAVAEEKTLRLNNIPNGRLRHVQRRLSINGFDSNCHPQPISSSWIDPHVLRGIAAGCGLELASLPSRSRDIWTFDAVLWRVGEQTPDLSLHPPEPMDRLALSAFSNVPEVGKRASNMKKKKKMNQTLTSVLGPWLAERLPAYMMPAFFVQLDAFPLTANGKIDRQALPDPLAAVQVTAKPTNEMERQLLATWAEILGHDRIGIDDNFFHVGGDSLAVVRVQAELGKLLGWPVSRAILFDFCTIKTLGMHLESLNQLRPTA